MSYKVQVIADPSKKWVSNGIILRSAEEARAYAEDLMSRWTSVTDTRVVPFTGPATHTFSGNSLKRIS